ncbi:MAG: glucose-1-phosphate thymidylyltransferase [Candidatus Marinimicrobia bacterium]|nr:glucose-1-phosphate thymidylyltransferase [Candidatus Neomarinimicrobiota bacterium]
MKNGGILLCGGSGTRLYPTTNYLNKHLIPIYDKPMVYYSISILLMAGIKDITIVCNEKDLDSYHLLLGKGEEFGVNLNYSVQDEPEGIPHAISTALNETNYEKFITVLGDNFIFGEKFYTKLEQIFNDTNECTVFSQVVKNPENFGVINVDKENNILSIEEKPEKFISNQAIIGLYIFNSDFESHYSQIKKSDRNEYEILDIISSYGLDNVNHIPIGRGTAWFDMGTTEDFYSTGSFVRTIQERQGLLVCSPHEIAFRNNWINKNQFESYITKIDGSEYSDNLKSIFFY